MTKSFVSVIILNHNGERFIEGCIKSVLAADYPEKEVIVVDDHSNDGSVRIVERYHKDVTLRYNNGKRGFAVSANTGIRHSSGDIIVLLNMDTLVDRKWLSMLVNGIKSDKSIGIVGSKIVYPDWKTIQYAGAYLGKSGISYHIGRGEIDAGQYDIPQEVDYACGASIGIRRAIIKEAGYFDEGYCPLYYEDVDFAQRVRRKGYKVMYIPGSIVSHYENCSVGKYSADFYYLYHKNRIRFVIKNCSLKGFILDFVPEERKWFKNATNSERYAALKSYILAMIFSPWLFIRRCLWKLNLI